MVRLCGPSPLPVSPPTKPLPHPEGDACLIVFLPDLWRFEVFPRLLMCDLSSIARALASRAICYFDGRFLTWVLYFFLLSTLLLVFLPLDFSVFLAARPWRVLAFFSASDSDKSLDTGEPESLHRFFFFFGPLPNSRALNKFRAFSRFASLAEITVFSDGLWESWPFSCFHSSLPLVVGPFCF